MTNDDKLWEIEMSWLSNNFTNEEVEMFHNKCGKQLLPDDTHISRAIVQAVLNT